MSVRFLPPWSLGLLALMTILSGCSSPPAPNPEQTRVGASGSSSDAPDWIDPTDIYGPGAGGLETRDPAFDASLNAQANLLPPVYFEFDSSFIPDGERPKLQQAAQYLRNNPGQNLVIEGHCDWRGTSEYNLALGDRRARSVQDYLAQLGLSRDRMETVSKGDLEAIVEASESQMAEDRRAALIVIP